MSSRERGFSVLELTIAMGIMMVITGAMFSLLNPSQATFAAQPEVSELQQRLRIAQDNISRDLLIAGSGPYNSPDVGTVGSLDNFIPSVVPFFKGVFAGMDDPAGSFFSNRITVFYVPVPPPIAGGMAEGKLAMDFTPGAGGGGATANLTVTQTNCSTFPGMLCGFQVVSPVMSILVADPSGNYDVFPISSIAGQQITVTVPPDAAGATYHKDSPVMQVVPRTYYVDSTTMPTNYQLKYYDGTPSAPVAIADHVLSVAFDYYGDPQPPQFKVPNNIAAGTTYGPLPPASGNCVFVDQSGTPRLPVLGDGSNPNTLIQLTAAQLTDGPWCGTGPDQWDADLLRIRKIGVRVRVEAAVDWLRGPAGPLFTRAGTSIGPPKWVPDQEVYFQIAPRNLNLGR